MSDTSFTGNWAQDHSFGQDQRRPGESRTLVVVGITVVMMVVEIAAGVLSGSMALLADGLHMAAHTAALGISVVAYVFARRNAHNRRFSFGTGKVNALGGFSGAILLVVFSSLMAWESVERLLDPVEIAYAEAITVAVIGLVVNAASALILGHSDHGHHDCGHHSNNHGCHVDHSGNDQNLRAAYLHVLADALTSIAAILGLLAGRYWGAIWVDPAVGVLGSLVVAKWSIGLLKSSGSVLLDMHAPPDLDQTVRQTLLKEADELADLHIWTIGPGLFAVEAIVISSDPQSPDEYRRRLPDDAGLAHVVVEVHRRAA